MRLKNGTENNKRKKGNKMSKVTRFRVWATGIETMVEIDDFHQLVFEKKGRWYVTNCKAIGYEADHEINHVTSKLMQYTGVNDKNDTEIYQGDIIKIKRDKAGYGFTSYGGYAEVTAQTCGYSFRCFNPTLQEIDDGMVDEEDEIMAWDSSSLWHLDEPENIEVIGNIYENKDLLG